MTRPSMRVAIDTLEVDLGERFRCRTPIAHCIDYRDWDERLDDIATIRGYIRAIPEEGVPMKPCAICGYPARVTWRGMRLCFGCREDMRDREASR